jgi:CheY-like chemotaxis protein
VSAGNERPSKVCVLVVDDDDMIRETLCDLLQDEGYSTLEAADGISAMNAILESQDHLVVLLDLVMPGMNGFDVLSLVTEHTEVMARHRFIVMTANKPAADSPSAVDPYFGQLLKRYSIPIQKKPFDIYDLLDAVARASRDLG